ncbi:D-amino acid dehydrogenase small subunit [Bacillus oleivorans]|uniref:D-amino acid dehydrogenase small subunit n=1 Tax=Bacillus oleivorans TaxID=1448271 RepID=A0A285CIH9_9BACI|nr:FAD-dependent oxidoreductase [Bacillus oleivorans]SNX66793.1 D-amino acid dehydrogenase small subunit [Bacillus oleivorans]
MGRVIVVGAGILGASAAYHLAKMGADVTIVDRFDPGQATEAAAGIVCPWLSQRRNKAWYNMVKAGARYYPELIKQLEKLGQSETGYKRVGALSLHSDPAKLEKLAERAIKRRQDTPEIGDIQILSPEETKSYFPLLSDEFGAVFVSGAARVNGRALRNALIQSAVQLGAKLLKDDARLDFQGSRVTGVKLKDKKVNADCVIVTAGVWAKDLLKPLGIEFLVTPQKAQIVHLQVLETETSEWPVVMPPNDQYILSFEEGRIVVGATHENEAGLDYRVTAGGIQEVLGKALHTAPGLASSTVTEVRVGFRPFTPDFLPVIGALPDFEGILVANGLGASGLTSGPFLGLELAKLALGKQTELDLKIYDVAGAIKLHL